MQGAPVAVRPPPAAVQGANPGGDAGTTPSAAWTTAHPHGQQGAYGPMPGAAAHQGAHWGSAAGPDFAMQDAGVAAAPEQKPFDILSFPAGLIPKLVQHALKCVAFGASVGIAARWRWLPVAAKLETALAQIQAGHTQRCNPATTTCAMQNGATDMN